MDVAVDGFADLHLHSNASDGSDPPHRVVERAHAAGLRCIALTDHDTVLGIQPFLDACRAHEIEAIAGVELSTLSQGREMHLLGYFVDWTHPLFLERLAAVRHARLNRAQQMVEKLQALGVPISWEHVQAIASEENVGRPHIARAMVEVGVIRKPSEAFTDTYIGNNGRAFVPRLLFSEEEALRTIHEAGGLAILAHPGRLEENGEPVADSQIIHLQERGLDGLEVYNTRHTPQAVAHYLALAQRQGLLITGGSDDHGTHTDLPFLGKAKLPYRYVITLQAAHTQK
ncbi:MAG: PHP domain-containing protein [Firmicutes bacterium]|nr:PHP domain-containing protein [Bacillota bacterium]